MFYTYAHYRPDNSVFYIGKGRGRRAWSMNYRNSHWRNIVAKDGEHKVEILAQWPTEQEAFEHEKFLIWCFRDIGLDITNMTDGGDGCSGLKHTEETRKKISKSSLGKVISVEQRKKMSDAHKGKKPDCSTYWLGKSMSDETKIKISKSMIGKTGHRKNLGKPRSEETKLKISLALKGRKTAPFSEEARKKMSESVKKSWELRRRNLKGN